jgi:hypothetical protein
MISGRPAEVADRAAPGHWEGDLIVGAGHRSAISTLVERTSRYVLLLHLPEGGTAEAVNAAIAEAIGRLPAELGRSVTWDKGTELSKHVGQDLEDGHQTLPDHALIVGDHDPHGRLRLAHGGTRRSTTQPARLGPAHSVPPHSSARSLIPDRPYPPPVAARAWPSASAAAPSSATRRETAAGS